MTKEQEAYLTAFADKGIAEQAEIEARNEEVLRDLEVSAAREAKQAELQAQADALIEEGMQEFELSVAATPANLVE